MNLFIKNNVGFFFSSWELKTSERTSSSSEQSDNICNLSSAGAVKIGKEEVEPDSVGEEIGLWQKMMQYPDSWAEGTLLLRCTMGKPAEK